MPRRARQGVRRSGTTARLSANARTITAATPRSARVASPLPSRSASRTCRAAPPRWPTAIAPSSPAAAMPRRRSDMLAHNARSGCSHVRALRSRRLPPRTCDRRGQRVRWAGFDDRLVGSFDAHDLVRRCRRAPAGARRRSPSRHPRRVDRLRRPPRPRSHDPTRPSARRGGMRSAPLVSARASAIRCSCPTDSPDPSADSRVDRPSGSAAITLATPAVSSARHRSSSDASRLAARSTARDRRSVVEVGRSEMRALRQPGHATTPRGHVERAQSSVRCRRPGPSRPRRPARRSREESQAACSCRPRIRPRSRSPWRALPRRTWNPTPSRGRDSALAGS